MKKFRLNLLQFFMLIFCVTATILSCSNENLEKNKISVNSDELILDRNFVTLTNEMNDYFEFLKETVQNHEQSSSELMPKINSIINSNLTSDEQAIQLDLLLEADISDRIKRNSIIIDSNWKALISKYDNLNEELLVDSFIKKLSLDNSISERADCNWRYYACLGAAFGAAVLCHAGCDAVAIVGTAGLGIPVCVIACGAIQVYASIQCYDAHCESGGSE